MAFSFNGMGTSFYGHDDEAPDGSYIATKWVVFLFLPMHPIASYRVRPAGDLKYHVVPPGSSQEFLAIEVPLHKKQVRKTQLAALKWIGIIILLIGLFSLCPR